ncbi:MAG: hypothetical protein Q9228_003143, partial [Teloschistes exilis]
AFALSIAAGLVPRVEIVVVRPAVVAALATFAAAAEAFVAVSFALAGAVGGGWRWGEAGRAGFVAVLPFAIRHRFAALCFVDVEFEWGAVAPAGAGAGAAAAAAGVVVAVGAAVIAFAARAGIVFFFFEAAEDFVEGLFAEVVGLEGFEFLECIDCAALVAFRGMLVVFGSPHHFLVQARKDEVQGILWQMRGPTDIVDVVTNQAEGTFFLFDHIPEEVQRRRARLAEHSREARIVFDLRVDIHPFRAGFDLASCFQLGQEIDEAIATLTFATDFAVLLALALVVESAFEGLDVIFKRGFQIQPLQYEDQIVHGGFAVCGFLFDVRFLQLDDVLLKKLFALSVIIGGPENGLTFDYWPCCLPSSVITEICAKLCEPLFCAVLLLRTNFDSVLFESGFSVLGVFERAVLGVFDCGAHRLSLENLQDQAGPNKEDESTASERAAYLPGRVPIVLRSSLYFDEQIDIFVALKTSGYTSNLQQQLSNLTISVEVYAFGSEIKSSGGSVSNDASVQSQKKDVIWSGAVDTAEPPLSLGDGNGYALVWRLTCFLSRPRVRMQHPMISFKISGLLRRPLSPSRKIAEKKYMPSGIAGSINVLESLRGVSGLSRIQPQLSALRLDRVRPADGLAVTEQVVRSKPQRLFQALPAISARVRYSNSGALTGQPCVIASLDIETSSFQQNQVQLTHVSMELSDGLTEDLCTGRACTLPITCQPKDNVVFLFRLRPKGGEDHSMHSDAHSSRMLDIMLDARVLLSDTCRPKIQMRWKTTVDFSKALSSKYSGPSQAMGRSNRPASLPVLPDNVKPQSASQDLNITTDPSDTPQQQRAASILDLGVTLTLTAPKDVYVGQPFTWDVFLVNRSNKTRKLAIVVVPKRRFGDRTSHMSKLSNPSGISGQRHDLDYAEPVMDENRLYAMQKANTREVVDIVCLSTDLRIGYVSSHRLLS